MMQTVICVTNNRTDEALSKDLHARCDPGCLCGCYFHLTPKREADKAGAWVGARLVGRGMLLMLIQVVTSYILSQPGLCLFTAIVGWKYGYRLAGKHRVN